MKMFWKLFIGFIVIAAAYGTTVAQDKKTLAVFPFTVHSADNIDYMRAGILGMLSSRIASSGKIQVKNREEVTEALKAIGGREPSAAEVEALGKSLMVDFVVWGSLTKIGSSFSIDGKLSEIVTGKSPVNIFTQTQSLDEVIPRIGDFAEKITQHVSGEKPTPLGQAEQKPAPAALTPAGQTPQPGTVLSSREAEIISAMRSGGKKTTLTAIINPDFINVPGSSTLDRRGFWMSAEFPNELKGMDIGDVNGDGLNEVVMIDSHNIFIYQKKGNEFKQLHQIRGKSHNNYLSVDVADINGNGIKEIIVTCINQNLLNSFVVEFKDGKFTEIASDIRLFLRVIETTPGQPILLGQTMGSRAIFDSPIHEVVWRGGQLRQDKRMKIPEGLPIYGLTIDSVGAGGDKIIVLNEFDHLTLYQPTDKPMSRIAVFGGSRELIYRSEDPYGGSNNYIPPPPNQNVNLDQVNNVYLNLRILTYDIEGKGKKAIIIPKNLSSAGKLFANIKLFSSSELYSLTWDGLGLAENWRTRKINGYVADYQIKDLDNDGKNEIVMVIVRGQGTGLMGNSVLVSYDLTVN
ncbi:MAG: FG-GAP-like repeat-containing protein [Smithellaceae bacterium]|nr:FG-GAP-like repeat-containing protein [Smithellaceae bacterium]